ncbi:hypothetical protein [Moorena sp. SIO3I6]|nr:hypothetical protein [Moorena sp. SIO3I6]
MLISHNIKNYSELFTTVTCSLLPAPCSLLPAPFYHHSYVYI